MSKQKQIINRIKTLVKEYKSLNESAVTITKQDMDRLHSGEEVDIDGHLLKFVDESVKESQVDPIKKKAEERYKNHKSVSIVGIGKPFERIKVIPRGKYEIVQGDMEGRYFSHRFDVNLLKPMKPFDLAVQLAQETGWISPWNYLEMRIGHSGKTSKYLTFPRAKTLFDESVNEAEIPKSELKMLDTVKKLAKKHGFKTIKNPDKWLKKIGHYEDGIVTVALFLHPDTKNDFGYVQVYHQEDEPEYLNVGFYAWGSSGNDSIDDWTTDEYWEDYFGEEDFEEEDFDESVNEAEKPLYKKGQKVQYKMEYSGGVGSYANSKSESPNIKTGVIRSRKKTLSSYKYVLSDGMTVYQSEIIGLA